MTAYNEDMEWLDVIIAKALKNRKKVELYLCVGVEGGFGIKIDGKIIARYLPWESFEVEIEKKQVKPDE